MKTSVPVSIIFSIALILLVSCSGEEPAISDATGSPISEVQAVQQSTNSDSVSSTGEVVPQKWVNLSFPNAGKELQIYVSVGDKVAEGQLLAELDDTDAQNRLEQAQQVLSEMTSPEAVANTRLNISTLGTDVYNAQLSYDNTVNWKSADRIKDFNAEYVLAQDEYERAKKDYEAAKSSAGNVNTTESAVTYTKYYDSMVAMDQAKFNLDTYSQKPSDRQIEEAAAKLDLVKAKLLNAKDYLTAITNGDVPETASGNELFQFRKAQRDVEEAEHALRDTKIFSPFNGSIVEINGNNGEVYTPGLAVIVVADFSTLQVLTKDMSEIDTGRIHIGDKAKVSFDALPAINVTGKVVQIALKNASGSGVYYTITIALDTIPPDLRWGMNAFVVITVK
jgi:HlyD family secretion protein